jgi:hypothetical protein
MSGRSRRKVTCHMKTSDTPTPTLTRIDPEAVPGLYAKHGFEPVRDAFLGVACRCCVNTILAVEAADPEQACKVAARLETYPEVDQLCELTQLDKDYAIGLAEGWDDCAIDHHRIKTVERLGYRDGKAAWAACQRQIEAAGTAPPTPPPLGLGRRNCPEVCP